LCNTERNDAAAVVEALLEHYLCVFPDPDLLHSDGGSHFDNAIIQGLTERRGWAHTICTPYAKWASGVAERNIKMMLDVLTPLCDELDIPVNKWPKALKLVQTAMNRRPRPSRNNRSPIELTTGIKPRTVASMIQRDGGTVDVLDTDATEVLDRVSGNMAEYMEEMYDAANLKRRAVSAQNRKRTDARAVPDIDVGDFVLYAEYKKHTKLDYTWLGPAVVTAMVTPLVFTIRPYTLYESETRDIHISRLRRFAGSGLQVTEQLQLAIERDLPDNIVGKIVSHEVYDGVLWMKCRWRGFTSELDSLQTATILAEDCPDRVREYYKEWCKHNDRTQDNALTRFMTENFPSLEHEQAVARQRRQVGAIATGRRTQQRRRGRTLHQLQTQQTNSDVRTQNEACDTTDTRRRTTTVRAAERQQQRAQQQQRQLQANAERDARQKRRRGLLTPATAMGSLTHTNGVSADADDSEGNDVRMTSSGDDEHPQQPVASVTRAWWSKPTKRRRVPLVPHVVQCDSMIHDAQCGSLRAILSMYHETQRHSIIMKWEETQAFTVIMTGWAAAYGATAATTTTNDNDTPAANANRDADSERVTPTQRDPAQATALRRLARKGGTVQVTSETLQHRPGVRSFHDRQLPTGEHAGTTITPTTHKRTRGWTLHTEVKPSLLCNAGKGLFMRERAKPKDRIARYYGELIGPAEATARIAAGAQYIVQANSKQFIDAARYMCQRGCYANDGGKKNNAKIATTVNRCDVTGEYWVSIIAKKTIKTTAEVYVPYGRSFARPWRKEAAPAMACNPMGHQHAESPAEEPHVDVKSVMRRTLHGLLELPEHMQTCVANWWNSARHWGSGRHSRKRTKACKCLMQALMIAGGWTWTDNHDDETSNHHSHGDRINEHHSHDDDNDNHIGNHHNHDQRRQQSPRPAMAMMTTTTTPDDHIDNHRNHDQRRQQSPRPAIAMMTITTTPNDTINHHDVNDHHTHDRHDTPDRQMTPYARTSTTITTVPPSSHSFSYLPSNAWSVSGGVNGGGGHRVTHSTRNGIRLHVVHR
jgi:hypothetical protein